MVNLKYNQLIEFIKKLGKVTLAYSGGVDSTFLAKACRDALKDNVMAVTAISPYIPGQEAKEAAEYAGRLKIKHEFIRMGILDEIRNNPVDRCYLCKKNIFNMIKQKAFKTGYKNVIDGTNYDDLSDFRPGLKALKELNIISPLAECKINKEEIRKLSRMLNLKTWDKPAYACLLTRLPYDTEIKIGTLKKIEKAEEYLSSLNIKAVRVRVHGTLARIEVDPLQRNLFFDTVFSDKISSKFKDIGFEYVTLDLEGYRMGSFNNRL